MSYAFSAPILFLYSNVIFLVGASWAPWGFRAAQVTRCRQPLGDARAGVRPGMQVLGGDPEAAYLTVAAGVLYASVLYFSADAPIDWSSGSRRAMFRLALLATLAWVVAGVGAAFLPLGKWIPAGALGRLIGPTIGVVLVVLVLAKCRREKTWNRLGTSLGAGWGRVCWVCCWRPFSSRRPGSSRADHRG